MKILLVGHACSPFHTSEPSFTWNRAWHLSVSNQVRVLTHPHEREAVEQFLAEHHDPNLYLVWVTPPVRCDPWNPVKGKRGTRLHFTPGDPDDLAAKVEWAWTHPERMEEMGRAARAEYETKYTAERNYQMLMDIYQRAIAAHRAA